AVAAPEIVGSRHAVPRQVAGKLVGEETFLAGAEPDLAQLVAVIFEGQGAVQKAVLAAVRDRVDLRLAGPRRRGLERAIGAGVALVNKTTAPAERLNETVAAHSHGHARVQVPEGLRDLIDPGVLGM